MKLLFVKNIISFGMCIGNPLMRRFRLFGLRLNVANPNQDSIQPINIELGILISIRWYVVLWRGFQMAFLDISDAC